MQQLRENTTPQSAAAKNEVAQKVRTTEGPSRFTKGLPPGLAKQRPAPYRPSRPAEGQPKADAPLPRQGELDASQLEPVAGALPSAKPRTAWDDLKEQASLAYSSGLLPRSVDSREKAITIAMMGRELGLSPMQALCGIYVVNGMTALRGSLMLRLIYERVPGARITVLTPPERAQVECAVEMQRPGNKPHVFKYTLEDARKAGFLNKPIWQQHTGTMLRWSAIRTGARIVFADAIAGCYMEDEIPGASSHATPVETPVLPHRDQLAQAQAMAEADKQKAPAESAPAAPSDTVASAAPHAEPAVEVPAPQPVVPETTPAATGGGESRYAAPRETVSSLPRGNRRVTEKQINRLFAIARAGNWPRQEIGRRMEEWFGKSEPKDLNWTEYDKLCNFLLEKPRRSGGAEAVNE